MAFVARDSGSSAARRRRERRLRSWLRHERMTVRMDLAAALHHSSFRGAGPVTYDAPRSQRTANSREDSVYFDLFDEDTEGARPDRLAGVRPQERDQRHTVEQIVDIVLFAPSLDVPVPQMDNQLVEVCRQLDVRIPEQVIEVPKISPTPRPPRRRRVRFAEQLAEQLVEVPTIISYSSLQRTVEQNVNIPVPGREGQHVGLQGFLPRQRSTALHASQERSSERIVEQIVDSRVLGGVSSASSSGSREHAGEGVFRTFPRVKKSPKLGSHSGSELLPESSPSTLSAHQMEEERQRAEKKGQTQERRSRHMRREMVEELFALGNLSTALRTPSVERRIAELVEAIDSGDSSAPPRRKRKKRKKRKTPKSSSFPSSSSVWIRRGGQGSRSRSCGRPCVHQRQVLAVHVVRVLRGAPVPVHRQSGGHSCFMSMDLADPVSSGKYSGTFVLTAPVAEPSVTSYTVPFNDLTIAATATVVISCSSSATCAAGVLRRDVVWWWFYCRWYLRFCLGQCEAGDWKFFLLFLVPRGRGCVCMLNGWFSSNDTICADNYFYFRFKLQACVAVRSGSCICTAICSSRWTVIAWMCCPGVCLRFGSSPNLATGHTPSMVCACLLCVAWE